MSVNSSSNSSLHSEHAQCFKTRKSLSVFTSYLISSILFLLPLFIFVLYVGYQRWRKQRSATTQAMMSHSDIFAFNMIVMELIGILGSCLYCYGMFVNEKSLFVADYILSSVFSGEIGFHLLTCVERYLAVVHPITYMGLRQSGGVRIRNISIVCIWLLFFGFPFLSTISDFVNIVNIFVFLVVSVVIVSFCSLSVLCVLTRPGPGKVGQHRESVKSKQRAFYTIMVIMGALLSRFMCSLVAIGLISLQVVSDYDACFTVVAAIWFNLPSSLVLPLLFLHRAGKLPGCTQH